MKEKEHNVQRFLDLIQKSRKGKFKIYIGMIAGVGKTIRMLKEGRALLNSGIDVKIGYVETHNRAETYKFSEGLPIIPRKKIFYKGKELEEMDTQAILNLRPEVVIVDELAHSNVEGSKNEKRWQDVLDILNSGINVITAVNIQHLESLNKDIRQITGIEVKERIPDSLLSLADEVVNIDLTADELITRLKEGKIYSPDKVKIALTNFFTPENILQLRELALKAVASQVERKVDTDVPGKAMIRHERFLACISSNEEMAKNVIRKTARLASYYNSKWFVIYVQTPAEDSDKIALNKLRYLHNNFKLARQLGAEIVKVSHNNIAKAIIEEAEKRDITTISIGKPNLSLLKIILATSLFNQLLKKLSSSKTDLIILS